MHDSAGVERRVTHKSCVVQPGVIWRSFAAVLAPSRPESAGTAVPRDAWRRFPRPRGAPAVRRATSPRPTGGPTRVRPPLAPADRSRLPAGPTPSGHVPSSEPRPAAASRPLDAPHAARPDHSRTRGRTTCRSQPPPVRQFVPLRRDAPGASCDFTPGREARPTSAPPLAPADRSRLPARPAPSGHVPSSGPRPTDGLRPLDAPHAARPDHSRHRRHNQQPFAAPPRDSSRDLGETHAARRATSSPGLEARPASAPPLAPADRSRLPARHTPRGHVPSAGPRPTDASRPLDAPHAARPDRSRRRRHNQQPLAAPPRDGSCDLGETHAARRATPRPPTAREEP